MINLKKFILNTLALGVSVAVVAQVQAGTEPYFQPLTQSSAVATPNHINELNSPWQTPAGHISEQLNQHGRNRSRHVSVGCSRPGCRNIGLYVGYDFF